MILQDVISLKNAEIVIVITFFLEGNHVLFDGAQCNCSFVKMQFMGKNPAKKHFTIENIFNLDGKLAYIEYK